MKFCKLLQVTLIIFSVLSFVMLSSAQASPYFAIGQNQWEQVLADGNVRGMDANEWSGYMNAWHDPNSYHGIPYPWTPFYPPQLYVYQPLSCEPNCCGPDFDGSGIVDLYDFAHFASYWMKAYYPYPKAPGLVMAWNPPHIDDQNSASAWVFNYSYDPDLRNTTVEIEVEPHPCITLVSFGFRDINGKRRAWYWACGAGKPINGRTKLIITTNGAGVSTEQPGSNGNDLDEVGFDITHVQSVIADEQNSWRAALAVPAPGQTVPNAWNYWYNLIVTPLPPPPPPPPPVPPPEYFKWRQPARYIDNQGNYWGWDEISVNNNKPLLADDWVCRDDRPVTEVNWWGSFPNKEPNKPGWIGTVLPPNPPVGFHICIWTDTPGHPQDMNIISHPNKIIAEYYCYDYAVNFVGFDRDPNAPEHPVTDACFRFSCDLEPKFVQDPNGNCLYWLSIAAIEPNTPPPQYLWGWKTRPHYSKDGAVRITSTQGGEWPPTLGSQWKDGNQLECPQWCSWDLAFELTTDRDANCP